MPLSAVRKTNSSSIIIVTINETYVLLYVTIHTYTYGSRIGNRR